MRTALEMAANIMALPLEQQRLARQLFEFNRLVSRGETVLIAHSDLLLPGELLTEKNVAAAAARLSQLTEPRALAPEHPESNIWPLTQAVCLPSGFFRIQVGPQFIALLKALSDHHKIRRF